jgi:serine/threonine-protein kinase
MKHVRDPLPDVQRRRPEISASLAAVVERATAKETRNRYQHVSEMVHDLEEVLAIEAARTGEATGEATTVLQSLSGDTADFAPSRLRRPRRTSVALTVLVLAMLAATAVFLAARTEKGTGGPLVKKPAELSEVRLAGGAARDYDPEGDNKESSDATRNAIDGNRGTNWNTETYQGGFEGSNKSGVGLYVDAGKLIRGRGLTLVTATPGFRAAVYGSETVPANLRGWTRLAPTAGVAEDHTFRLRTRSRLYRYYLLWINELPEDGKAEVQELSLLK